MKEFWKDYVELQKESIGFCKKHWKGLVAVNAVLIGAELAYFAYQNHKFNKAIQGCFDEENEDE